MSTKEFNEFFCKDIVGAGVMLKLEKYFRSSTFNPVGYVSEPKCPVCSHVLRPQIEEMIYAAVPVNLINEFAVNMGYQDFSSHTIKSHASKHCAVMKASQALAEERHRSRVEELSRDALGSSDALNVIINTFAEMVERGETPKVTTGNVIKAVEVKNKIEGAVPFLEMMSGLFIKEKREKPLEGEVEDVEEAVEVVEDDNWFSEEISEVEKELDHGDRSVFIPGQGMGVGVEADSA